MEAGPRDIRFKAYESKDFVFYFFNLVAMASAFLKSEEHIQELNG